MDNIESAIIIVINHNKYFNMLPIICNHQDEHHVRRNHLTEPSPEKETTKLYTMINSRSLDKTPRGLDKIPG